VCRCRFHSLRLTPHNPTTVPRSITADRLADEADLATTARRRPFLSLPTRRNPAAQQSPAVTEVCYPFRGKHGSHRL
jgi:hypothetical protein